MKNKGKWFIAIAIVIIIILAGYWLFNASKLKSCYLYEGHLNSEGNDIGGVIIAPYITIYNPNQDSFDRFELQYTIVCNGEPVVYDSLTHTYPNDQTSLTRPYNNFFGKEYRISSTDVSESTWQKIQSDTAEWIVQGRLITYLMDDYYFTIEQTGFWQYQG
jgi:hypothetical protein